MIMLNSLGRLRRWQKHTETSAATSPTTKKRGNEPEKNRAEQRGEEPNNKNEQRGNEPKIQQNSGATRPAAQQNSEARVQEEPRAAGPMANDNTEPLSRKFTGARAELLKRFYFH